ncbi:site-specific DNA-methyltransferase, partial [Candidatus Roizmanbacteria bacterium CG10_big_fil_rev_8_21_14_0_10_39_6]
EKTRKNLVFDIFYNPKTMEVKTGPVDSELHKGFIRISPKKISSGANKYYAWRWSQDKIKNEKIDLDFIETKTGWTVFTKRRDYDNTILKDIITNIATVKGSNDLAKLNLERFFDYPKPTDLVKLITKVIIKSDSNDIILDFFSGSSTTAHAVMQLNAEDGGNRKF